MRMGNWTHLTDIDVCEEECKYRYYWLRVHGEVGYSECIRHLTDIGVCEEECKYRYYWLRVHGEVGYSECIRLIPLITQGTGVRSVGCVWSPVFKAKQIIRNFTDLQCVLKLLTTDCACCNMSPGVSTWFWMEWWKDSAVSDHAILAA